MSAGGSPLQESPDRQPPPWPVLEALLFDLDGTLVDTDDAAVAWLSERLGWLAGRRAPSLARRLLMAAETPGNWLVMGLDALDLEHRLAKQADTLRRRRGVYAATEFVLIPGVDSMMQALNGRYKLGLVTSRSRQDIERFLAGFPAIGEALDVSCGLQDARRMKPHPRPVQLAAERLGVPISRCLMIGDTTTDIKAGRRAGAWTAGVLCGFGQHKELVRAGAHLVVPTTTDILRFV